jgi:hypothetical protein
VLAATILLVVAAAAGPAYKFLDTASDVYYEIKGDHLEGYAKLSLKKYSPIAARNDDLKVFRGRR